MTKRESLPLESDGVTAKCIVLLSPFVFAFMIYITLDVLVLNGLIKEFPVYNITTQSYCTCVGGEPFLETVFLNDRDTCNSFCVNDQRCKYTYTEYTADLSRDGSCSFFNSACEQVTCVDPFNDNLTLRTMGIKNLELIKEKL